MCAHRLYCVHNVIIGVCAVKTKRLVIRVEDQEHAKAHQAAGKSLSDLIRQWLAAFADGRLTIQEATGKQ